MTETSNSKFGDYQCNSAMIITKELKAKGDSKRPVEVGELIKKNLASCELIDKVFIYNNQFKQVFLRSRLYLLDS